jgi:Carboxymuconolactone decarboxylase family
LSVSPRRVKLYPTETAWPSGGGTDRDRRFGGVSRHSCAGFHAKVAVGGGATREEILETLGMAIYMGGGPAAMHASRALGAPRGIRRAKN